MFGDLMIL